MVDGEEAEEDDFDDDDDALAATKRPYADLMQSLLAGSGPAGKRRKLAAAEPKRPVTEAPRDDVDRSEGSAIDVDKVDEPEEPALETDAELVLDEADEVTDRSDPFESHFAEPDDQAVSGRIKAMQKGQWKRKDQVVQGFKVLQFVPLGAEGAELACPEAIPSPQELKLKRRLATTMSSKWTKFNAVESVISPYLFQYYDLLFCERTLENAKSMRRAACLHAVNHVFKYGEPSHAQRCSCHC